MHCFMLDKGEVNIFAKNVYYVEVDVETKVYIAYHSFANMLTTPPISPFLVLGSVALLHTGIQPHVMIMQVR